MHSENIVKSKINRLTLHNFRNYRHLDFIPQSNHIIITGSNGVGKTNILEAISLLAPGRGLLNNKLEDMDTHGAQPPWKIEALIEGHGGSNYIATGRVKNDESSRRFIEIDEANFPKQAALSKIVNISWVVPQMDQIFITGASVRRKLLDRIVSNFEFEYSKQLTIYEYYLKERSNLLKNVKYDSDWMKVIEHNMAQAAVIIATARIQIVEMLQQVMDELEYDFPKALLSIEGLLEEKIHKMPALQIEKEFAETLLKNRAIDSFTKRTNAGIHRSDLLVCNKEKGIKAKTCSTGEQKSLLISLFLTEIFAQIQWRNQMPIILLDDIVAHLDEERRRLLSDIILNIGAQVWITGTDQNMFRFIKNNTEFVTIKDNKLTAYCNE
jgi:DNA replication and repair protein RecF